jgi:glycosyltransferase involved in cell wall biosynthesis
LHVLFIAEEVPESSGVAGGLRVSIRRLADELSDRCRVTLLVLHRVLPPLRRYEKKMILPRAWAEVSPGGKQGPEPGGEAGEGPISRAEVGPGSAASGEPPAGVRGSRNRAPNAGLRIVNYRYLHLPVVWKITEPLQTLMLSLCCLLRHARDADLLHGHCLYPAGVPAALIGRLSRRPSLVTAYGHDVNELAVGGSPVRRWWIRRVLRGATRLVAVSESLMRGLGRLGVDDQRRRHVPSGTDLHRFTVAGNVKNLRQELGLPAEAHIFLVTSLFEPVKGHAVLIDAYRQICNRRPHTYLVMTADGPLRKDIAARVENAGLQECVRFTGLVAYEEIPRWVAAADTLVLPSLNEGMPLSVLEAFASGKPVVASAVGGVPELISDEHLGILVPPQDPAALASAMEQAMDREWDAELLRARAAEFAWPLIGDRLLEIYRETMEAAG